MPADRICRMAAVHPEIMAGFERLMPRWHVAQAVTLAGGDETVVQRLTVRDEAQRQSTVIGKLFTGSGESYVRESAALASLPSGLPVPMLLAEQQRPPLLLLNDIGTGPSVADALLGRDPSAAARAVSDWATAIGTLHVATLGAPGAFTAQLRRRADGPPLPVDPTAGLLDDAIASLGSRAALTGLRVPEGLRDELTELIRRLTDPACSALSPADACPDNNVRDDSGALRLVDFEGAAFRHVAWDVSYLTVPWPSCWCCWRLPAEVTSEAVDRYRATVRPVLPSADGDGFRQAVDRAAIGWAVITTAWFLARAIDGDPPMTEGDAAPRRRAFLLHRLRLAIPRANADDLPVTAATLAEWHESLTGRWGPVPLPLAPAFRLRVACGLKLDGDVKTVGDHEAASRQRHVTPFQHVEVAPVDLRDRREPQPGLVPGVGDHAIHGEIEGRLPCDAVHGEITVYQIVARRLLADRSRSEIDGRVPGYVQDVRSLNLFVTDFIAGCQRRGIDGCHYRGCQRVFGDADRSRRS